MLKKFQFRLDYIDTQNKVQCTVQSLFLSFDPIRHILPMPVRFCVCKRFMITYGIARYI